MATTCCFTDLVSVRGCTDVQPRSGFYLNDLPGITTGGAALIANAEAKTGQLLLQDKLRLATQFLKSELKGNMLKSGRFALMETVTSHKVGVLTNGTTTLVPHARGVRITNPRHRATKMAAINIRCVTLYPAEDATGLTLDIVSQEGTTSYAYDAVANVPVDIIVDYTSKQPQVDVLADPSITYRNTLTESRFGYSSGCLGCGAKSVWCGSDWLWVAGLDGNAVSSQTFGVALQASLICQQDDIFCAFNATQLGEVLMYRAGMEVAKEALYGSRINSETLKKEAWAQLLNEWETEYTKKIALLIDSSRGMLGKYCQACIKCANPMIGWR